MPSQQDADEELIKNLDLLLSMEAVEAEENWDTIGNLEDAEKADSDENNDPSIKEKSVEPTPAAGAEKPEKGNSL